MSNAGIDFSIESPDLPGLLRKLKEINPKLATSLRRELRSSGDVIIQAQRAELAEGGPSATGTRDEIASGLKTRVVAGKTRQGIDIKTTGPKRDGYNLARIFQSKTIRHPLFGSDTWVEQPGRPYFFEPATSELRDLMRDRIQQVIAEAIEQANRTL